MIDQHQWGFGTSNLMGHSRTEPETEILKLVRGLRNRVHVPPGARGHAPETNRYTGAGHRRTPMNSADVGTRVGGRKGFDDGNGGIGGKALVVNQLRAEEDTELVSLVVEVVLGPDDTGNVSLWAHDVPLEGESHVSSHSRQVSPGEQCTEPTGGTG
jgi:hypothetical protein